MKNREAYTQWVTRHAEELRRMASVNDKSKTLSSALARTLDKTAAFLKEEWQRQLNEIDRGYERESRLRAPIQWVPCNTYGCTAPKPKGAVF